MNKIKQLHLRIVDKINPFSIYDTNRYSTKAKMNSEIASKSAKITEEIAIKFINFILNDCFIDFDCADKRVIRYNGESYYGAKELFHEFLKTKSNGPNQKTTTGD